MARPATPAEILHHTDGLRQLAYHLVRQAADADDAVQETLLQALRCPPQQGATTGAWLKQVLRNVVRKSHRSSTRRAERERGRGTPLQADQPTEHMERIEQASALLAAMRQLSSEKRDAVELRYLEGLPPRAIAARLGVPVDTVKTRLKRGLAELRETLDAERDRRWPAAFATAFGMTPSQVSGVLSTSAMGGLMTHKGIVMATVSACLLVGVWLWWIAVTAQEPAVSFDAADAFGHGRAQPRRLPATEAAPGLRGAPGKDPAPIAPRGETQAAIVEDEPSEPRKIRVRGTLRLHDEGDKPIPVPVAQLRMFVWGETRENWRVTDVHEGRFAFELEEKMYPEFKCIALGSRIARVRKSSLPKEMPQDGRFDLIADLVPPMVIHVLDAETGRPLDDVEYKRRRPRETQGRTSRMETAYELRRASGSPLRIDPLWFELIDERARLTVGRHGYAWRNLDIDTRRAAEMRVELVPGGSLALSLVGPALRSGAHVRLNLHTGRSARREREYPVVANQTIHADRLPPGEYTARVELGNSHRRPLVLGETRFSIRAGDQSAATLRYAAVPAPTVVPFAGTVEVPMGWKTNRFTVVAQFLGTKLPRKGRRGDRVSLGKGLEPVAGSPGVFRFDFEGVQAGRYVLHFFPMRCVKSITIGRAGLEDARLSLPPPVTVRLRLVGEREDLSPVSSFYWRAEMPSKSLGTAWRSVSRNADRGLFEFEVPAGPIYIRPDNRDYQRREERLDVPLTGTEATYRLQPAYRVALKATTGNKALNWEWSWPKRIESLDGGGKISSWTRQEHALVFELTSPGRYRLHLGPVEGYEPVAPLDFEVSKDGTTEVRVELEPRK